MQFRFVLVASMTALALASTAVAAPEAAKKRGVEAAFFAHSPSQSDQTASALSSIAPSAGVISASPSSAALSSSSSAASSQCYGHVRQKDASTGTSRQAWKAVVCATQVTPDLVKSLQGALKKQGHYTAKADGILNPATRKAIDAFQQKQNLAHGELTLETLDRLGVKPKAE